MKALKKAKQRAELSRHRSVSRYVIDDEMTGLWAEKRARQARCREQVKAGQRAQESCFFIAPELVHEMKVRHRP
ncbi:hypothetical protein [Burkholderia ubonensis]|uniref:hypothetical protein n=1 Tax=Burkholderia ubonensis TaxID=101571 RepID=UPI00075AF6DF|nr:hypothetical protein [Burkholderia ubonensis]KVC84347.1 hypothetical protein WI75_04655 [Burkholderia ubonensis]